MNEMLINKLDEMHRLVTNELVHEIEINKSEKALSSHGHWFRKDQRGHPLHF